MKQIRIVLITYYWPPQNAIATHRPYAWAQHWSQSNFEITVLTSKKTAIDEPLDLLHATIKNVNVIEVPYKSGFEALYSNPRLFWIKRFLKRIKNKINRLGVQTPEIIHKWGEKARPYAIKLAADADIVVTTYGPAEAHLLGSAMKAENRKLFWVADYRDLWSQNHTHNHSHRTRAALRKIEMASVGKNADMITTVSHDLAKQISTLMNKTVHYIPNGFDFEESEIAELLGRNVTLPKGSLRIIYTGKIYEGFQDPTPLLEALAELRSANEISENAITIDFYGTDVAAFQKLAENPRHKKFIRVMGYVKRDEAINVQRNAGLLLLLESSKKEARGILTGKIFEYLAAGRPIICIGSNPEFEIGKILTYTGTGKTYSPNNIPAIKDAIISTIKGGGLYATYAPNKEAILEYSRARQSKKMTDIIMINAKSFS
jgi:glycosyltransferase involved in cell wall biosynthesis